VKTVVNRGLRFDLWTDKALRNLAEAHEGNLSMTVRELVRDEARRQGLWPSTLRPARTDDVNLAEAHRD